MHNLHIAHPVQHIQFTALYIFRWLKNVAEGCIAKTNVQEDEDAEEAVTEGL